MQWVLPNRYAVFSLCLAAMVVFLASNTQAVEDDAVKKATISEAEVNAAQQAWCDGLMKIGKVHKDGGDFKAVASKLIDDLYDYKEGSVFFKPTLAFGKNTFRNTKEGALSYFIGGNKDFPEDTGFALKQVMVLRQQCGVNGIQIHGDIVITLGVYFTADGKGRWTRLCKWRCKTASCAWCAWHSRLNRANRDASVYRARSRAPGSRGH